MLRIARIVGFAFHAFAALAAPYVRRDGHLLSNFIPFNICADSSYLTCYLMPENSFLCLAES